MPGAAFGRTSRSQSRISMISSRRSLTSISLTRLPSGPVRRRGPPSVHLVVHPLAAALGLAPGRPRVESSGGSSRSAGISPKTGTDVALAKLAGMCEIAFSMRSRVSSASALKTAAVSASPSSSSTWMCCAATSQHGAIVALLRVSVTIARRMIN